LNAYGKLFPIEDDNICPYQEKNKIWRNNCDKKLYHKLPRGYPLHSG
jgi:hypothetical protein